MKRIPRNVQILVATICILLGVALLVYHHATYAAYSRCETRYRQFFRSIDSQLDLQELLRSAGHQDMYSQWLLFRPCGYLYSGWNRLIPLLGAGGALLAIGLIAYADLLIRKRIKKGPKDDIAQQRPEPDK